MRTLRIIGKIVDTVLIEVPLLIVSNWMYLIPLVILSILYTKG